MKDAYYFSHDSNARHDRKIVALRRKYGYEGYGRYFAIIEMLREQSDYRMELDEITFENLAEELTTNVEQVKIFVDDLLKIYKLLVSDGDFIWSESLNRRMGHLDTIREKRRDAGLKSAEQRALSRDKELNNPTSVEQVLNTTAAVLQQNPTKESKLNLVNLLIKEKENTGKESPERETPKNEGQTENSPSGHRLNKGRELTIKEYMKIKDIPGYEKQIERIT